ncbi:type II secretion system F family protein [Leifsonia sp. 2TAF2]|uniref:type II secretion system F family protein n=1 Tax=Leifsonia sp. 2TAF2 TaxID=3233009 RepID=UPI003F9CDC2F
MRTVKRLRLRQRPGEAADATAALAESLAVLLDAGLSPRSAWRATAAHRVHPVAARVVSALASQPSCARALIDAASTDDVRMIAAAWRVAEQSGAPLGHALRTVGETLRDVAEAEREADVALSGPRATARLISWLPAVGVAMTVALGADLIGTLTSTAGALAVGAGLLLLFGGRWWMRALVVGALARKHTAGQLEELVAVALAGGASAEAAIETARAATAAAGLPANDDGPVRSVIDLAASAGAPAAELLTAAARQQRRSARADARRSAATLGVRLLLPLGLCVLPSFLLLAVAPLVLSLLSSTTTGLW